MSTTTAAYNDAGREDYTLSHAHGTVMVFAWMIFGSTGILFARYGRLLEIGGRVKILGEHIWFQIHRLALCIAAIATLLGFFLVLAQAEGKWVTIDAGAGLLAHSILGGTIVCCAQIQLWMALFRCHPTSRFRFIFNWLHRFVGLFAFVLSIPTIFLIVFVLPAHREGLIAILSIWSGWVVIIVIIFETIEFHSRKTSVLSTDNRRSYEVSASVPAGDTQMERTDEMNTQSYSKIKIFFYCLHIIVAISLVIPLIVFIWTQG